MDEFNYFNKKQKENIEMSRLRELARRREKMLNMTIREQIGFVSEIICDDFCKYPDEYHCKYKDPDIARDTMNMEVCEKWCPFMLL